MKPALKRKHLYFSLLAIALAGGVYLYQNAEGMIIRTTEKIASDALGVSVDIDGMHVALSEKKLTVRGIKIGNPSGFKQPHSVTAETVDVTLGDFSSKEIDFKNITVKGSVVYLELNDNGMNVLALKERMGRKEQKQKKEQKQSGTGFRGQTVRCYKRNIELNICSGRYRCMHGYPWYRRYCYRCNTWRL